MPLSTFLNGQTPSQLRGLDWLALSDTGSVLSPAFVDDAGGGATQTWTAGAAVPCSIESMAYSSGIIAARIDERSTHLVNVPVGTQVDLEDRFQITGRGTFEVTALHQQTAEWITEFEVVKVS